MNTQATEHLPDVQEIREGISDYRITIKVLQSFASLITWDTKSDRQVPGSNFAIGRKMDTSIKNKIHPNNNVTPDLVVQSSPNLGYIVEAKSGLPKNQHNWLDYVRQLQKYDDGLIGWWTNDENLPTSCIVLLLDITRSGIFKAYLNNLIQSGQVFFDRPISIVEFTRTPQVKEFWFLRKHWGDIKDNSLSTTLDTGVSIPIEDVVANPVYGKLKFYDAKPPFIEHTMEELWQNIFNERKQEVEYDESLRAWPLRVNVNELTKELQKLYGSKGKNKREVAFPLNEWIREALDSFVYLKLAQKEEDGNYDILFRLIKEDLISYFAGWRSIALRDSKRVKSKQLELFKPAKK